MLELRRQDEVPAQIQDVRLKNATPLIFPAPSTQDDPYSHSLGPAETDEKSVEESESNLLARRPEPHQDPTPSWTLKYRAPEDYTAEIPEKNEIAPASAPTTRVTHHPLVPVLSTSPGSTPTLSVPPLPASIPICPPSRPLIEILPIEQYREEILALIRRDRVTIIQGQTGCGKSSRLPVMLLDDADSRGEPCRIMVG